MGGQTLSPSLSDFYPVIRRFFYTLGFRYSGLGIFENLEIYSCDQAFLFREFALFSDLGTFIPGKVHFLHLGHDIRGLRAFRKY